MVHEFLPAHIKSDAEALEANCLKVSFGRGQSPQWAGDIYTAMRIIYRLPSLGGPAKLRGWGQGPLRDAVGERGHGGHAHDRLGDVLRGVFLFYAAAAHHLTHFYLKAAICKSRGTIIPLNTGSYSAP